MYFEVLIDIYNMFGMGFFFVVFMNQDCIYKVLVGLFIKCMLVIGLKLGVFFEYSECNVVMVIIECGGLQDLRVDQIVYQGIMCFVIEEDVFDFKLVDWDLEVLFELVRLELIGDICISYGNQEDVQVDIILLSDVENYNFGWVSWEVQFGWVNLLSWYKLKMNVFDGKDVKDKLLCLEGCSLFLVQVLKLFMIIINLAIVLSDCVFYVVRDSGSDIDQQRFVYLVWVKFGFRIMNWFNCY